MVDHLRHLALARAELLRHRADELLGDVHHEVLHRLERLAVFLVRDDLGLADLHLEALAPHRLDEDRELQLAAPRDLEGVGVTRSASTRSATLLRTFSLQSRSRSWVEVTNLPSLPANGDTLAEKSIDTVGSSMRISGSATGFSGSAMVSPISMASMPATATMSPAEASATSTRLRPS